LFRKTFIYSSTDKVLEEGQTYTRPTFAKTLEEIAEKGPQTFYTGNLGKALVEDLQKMGGIITMEDLMNYRLRIYILRNISQYLTIFSYTVSKPKYTSSCIMLGNYVNILQVLSSWFIFIYVQFEMSIEKTC
jgi:gamma-glutamyltranspeptidase